MAFRIVNKPDVIEVGSVIDYKVRIGPVAARWKTNISAWEPGLRFVDQQERGPYRCWWHEHTFRPDNGGTIMEDRVFYAPPFGPLGRLTHWLFIKGQLQEIFGYRADAILQRFG